MHTMRKLRWCVKSAVHRSGSSDPHLPRVMGVMFPKEMTCDVRTEEQKEHAKN